MRSDSSRPFARNLARYSSFVRRIIASAVALALTAVALVSAVSPAQAATNDYLFWSQGNSFPGAIQRGNANGKGAPKTLASGLQTTMGVAANSRYLFWVSAEENGTLMRSDFNGGNRKTLASGLSGGGYSLTVSEKYVYWPNITQQGSWIARVGIDGSGENRKFVTVDPTQPAYVMAVAVDTKYLYWSLLDTAEIWRANIGGAGKRKLISNANYVYGLVAAGGYVYWGDNVPGQTYSIAQAKSDGTAIKRKLISVSGPITGLASNGSQIFWVAADQQNEKNGKIERANLNGSSVKRNLWKGIHAWGLAVVPGSGRFPQSFRKGTPPKKVKFRGTTVINKVRATTVQGQRLKAKVRVTGLRGELNCLRVKTLKNRKVTVRTYGRCTFTLRVTYTAPGNSQYKAFKKTKVYRVKR